MLKFLEKFYPERALNIKLLLNLIDRFNISEKNNLGFRMNVGYAQGSKTLLNPDNLLQGEVLGQGSFATVYKGEHDCQEVAIKILNTVNKEEAIEGFEREVKIMMENSHSRVVQIYKTFAEDYSYKIVMEYMSGGSLEKLLRSTAEISWFIRHRIAKEIGSGMAFLHHNGIVHCDLKTSNILLDNQLHAKITDFGISRIKSERSTFGPGFQVGTFCYMAPELMEKEDVKITETVDVYSYGVVLWELCARIEPMKGFTLPALARRVVDGPELREPIDPSTPESIVSLITRCWKRNQAERPTMLEIVQYLGENPMVDNSFEEDNAEKEQSVIKTRSHEESSKIRAITQNMPDCEVRSKPFQSTYQPANPIGSQKGLHVFALCENPSCNKYCQGNWTFVGHEGTFDLHAMEGKMMSSCCKSDVDIAKVALCECTCTITKRTIEEDVFTEEKIVLQKGFAQIVENFSSLEYLQFQI